MAEINYTGNMIKVEGSITRVRFYNNNFGIIEFKVEKTLEGSLRKGAYISCKGSMAKPDIGQYFTIKADEYDDPKWGLGYQITQMYTPFNLDDPESAKKFLTRVFTQKDFDNIYAIYDNPIPMLENEDIEAFIKVKGFGIKRSVDAINKYKEKKLNARIYIELIDFNLSDSIIEKLMKTYKGNPDLVIDMVKNNPYLLCKDVYGVGFKTCDKIALEGGIEPNSPLRIGAFIRQYLIECANNGYSWITPDHLLGGILDTLGDEVTDEAITESLHSLGNELWTNESKTQIGLSRFYKIEYQIAEQLYRLMKADSDVKNDNWMDTVKKIERQNGWEFTDEQLEAVRIGMENNVFVLTGGAGSGKSSTVQAILNANKGKKFVQCALSGRASSKLFEVTRKEGKTIHRLLGYPQGDPEHGGFIYHENNKLDVDIVIVDECSMISGDLFLSLIRAIPDGAKLVLLGDTGQLPAIGSGNILNDIIDSDEIPCINLTKIHRQAAKSAIITQSLKARRGEYLIPKDWVGEEVRGELKDLDLTCYSDKSNTFYEVNKRFSTELSKPDFDIMQCQIIIPIRTRGDACTEKVNTVVQELYNPKEDGKKEYTIEGKNVLRTLRVGDKVINSKNCYDTTSPEDENGMTEPRPIYNGSIGIVKDILYNHDIIVDFAFIGEVLVPSDKIIGLELGYASTVHKCVTGDTWIYTEEGIKQIKELDNGANIHELRPFDHNIPYVYNGKKLEQPSHFYNAGASECKKIVTKRGFEITATVDHSLDVITSNGDLVKKMVKDITNNDFLLIRKGQEIFRNKVLLPDEWYSFKQDIRSINYHLPREMDANFGYFLGGMVADGVITDSGFRYGKNQRETVEKMREIINTVFNYSPKVVHLFSGLNGGFYQTEINSKRIRQFLRNIDGIQPNNKFVPQCVLEGTKEAQIGFLKGIFEDGSVNTKKGKFDHIELMLSGDGKCIKQIRMMLLNLGIISSYREIKSKKNNIKNKHVIYIYKKDAMLFKEMIGFTSHNKVEGLNKCIFEHKPSSSYTIPFIKKIESLLNELEVNPLLINKNLLRYFNTKKTITDDMLVKILKYLKQNVEGSTEHEIYKYIENIYNNYYLDPVLSTEETVEHTYCITMPETHKFVQNGIQGWNCQGSEWDTVILALDYSAYSLLSKQLIYTAMTRAKKKLYMICQNKALNYAVTQDAIIEKQTHLQDCLHEVFHPKLIF